MRAYKAASSSWCRRSSSETSSVHAVYVTAVAVALHPVFLTASAVMVVAFGLSWLLRDVPLRETAGSDAAAPLATVKQPAPSSA